MTPDFIAALVEEMDGKLPDAVIAKARASLVEQADTPVIAARIARFLEG